MARRAKDGRVRVIDASEQRQYLQEGSYEVYEKIGPPTGATEFHYHDFYEIIFISEGQFASQVGDVTHELRKGDFLLIGRNTLHRYYPEEKKHDTSRRFIIWIRPEMLDELSGGETDLSACFREGSAVIYHFPLNYEDILGGFLIKLAMSELVDDVDPVMRRVMDRGYLALFFSYLNVLCERHSYIYADSAVMENTIVEEIDRYIEEHIEEPVTIDELAGAAHLSKYYFVRRFKELTGVTAHTYLINKRLIRACELLKDGEEVMNVYSAVGFSDYSVFLRNFRKVYGVSPREYAKEG
ncbi:MAG: helix-turn-helix domain-containing protein [Lachnospiraceae bacterium]|nr:helix-turn-helix domain-containing protein [Lachnospiraceae bacterium]